MAEKTKTYADTLINETQGNLKHLGAGTLDSVRLDRLKEAIDSSHKAGHNVVDDLVGDISQWVLNPRCAAIMAFGLSLGAQLATQKAEDQAETEEND